MQLVLPSCYQSGGGGGGATESIDPTHLAKGRMGDCPGPTTTRRNVTLGGGGGRSIKRCSSFVGWYPRREQRPYPSDSRYCSATFGTMELGRSFFWWRSPFCCDLRLVVVF